MKEKRVILQELESDDELPESYNDVAVLPAFLDNNRFEVIRFPWVHNLNTNSKVTGSKTNLSRSQHLERILRYKGFLKGQDLYCLKSVESSVSSTTIIWFINYLLYKDLQSQFNSLKSCLVNDIHFFNPLLKKCYNESEVIIPNDRFEIHIKV